MTTQQKNKIQKLGNKVLDYYENTTGSIVVTMKYGTSRFCKTFIGVRGGMSYQECKVYKGYSKEEGLTGFLFKYVT